jgi:hypothetical protein
VEVKERVTTPLGDADFLKEVAREENNRTLLEKERRKYISGKVGQVTTQTGALEAPAIR